MDRISTLRLTITLSILTALGFGCAAFRGGRLGAVPAFSQVASPGAQKSITIVIATRASFNGSGKDVPGPMAERWEKPTMRAYGDSKYFADVKKGLEQSDLRAEITITDAGEGSQAGAFITGFTLFLIPTKATDVMTIATSFKDRDGNDLGTLVKTEEVSMWMELLLIFATPFAWPGTIVDDVLYDLNRATLIDAAQQGWFDAREAVPSASR